MDMTDLTIASLSWGGSALAIWGFWKIAFRNSRGRTEEPPRTEEKEIRELEREIERM